MTEAEAAELQAVLTEFIPRGTVEVAADPAGGGARIVIESDGRSHRYSIQSADSPLLRHLLTGYPD